MSAEAVAQNTDSIIRIHAVDRIDMEYQIELGIESLRMIALRERQCGILVTRHSARDFTVRLDPNVPFGVTREKRAWAVP
jgi:hypothetical protein